MKQALEKETERFIPDNMLSLDVIWDWNLMTGEMLIGEGFKELFGFTLENNKRSIAEWKDHIHPDDKEAVEKELKDTLASSVANWGRAYRFIRTEGAIGKVYNRISIFRHADGTAYRVIGIILDISRQRTSNDNSTVEKADILISKIKSIITGLIHYSEEQTQAKFSAYLSGKLGYNYTYLADLFSEKEGISIQKFLIAEKLEFVKELLIANELNITEIAWKLNYSSVAHLSNQFKKAFGFTPSHFRNIERNKLFKEPSQG